MYKFFSAQIFLLLVYTSVYAQNIRKFEFDQPQSKVRNSAYNSLRLLDMRDDTTNIGIVQTGFLNRKAKVIAAKPLAVELNGLFRSLVNTTAGNHELLLQLRHFSFAEITSVSTEKGYCYLRADIYSNQTGQYQRVNSIDTVVVESSSIDVTKMILKAGGKTLTDFIKSSILMPPASSISYTYNDLLKIDSLEKVPVKLYNTNVYTDGLYLTYKAFEDQTPDKQIVVETKDTVINTVKITDGSGKLVKIKKQDAFAIVYKGQPYIATAYGYYPLKKINNDFFFTGKAAVSPGAGGVITAGVFFGIAGSLIASSGSNAMFEMKIDHKNGDFIRLKEIPAPPIRYGNDDW